MNIFQQVKQQAHGDGLKARLIRGGLGTAGIQAANRVLMLALGIVLARTLGPEGYGVYAYAFAIMSLLMVVAEAGVPSLLMREIAAAQGQHEWGLLRGSIRRGQQLVSLTASTVSLLGLIVLWGLSDVLRPPVLYSTALMFLVLPMAAIAKVLAHAIKGLRHVVVGQAIARLLRPLLVLLFVGTSFMLWPELRQPQYAMAAQLGASFLVLLLAFWLLRTFLPIEFYECRPEFRDREWVKSALPFTLIGGAGIINNQADIIMLGWFLASEDVGIYRVAMQGAILVAFGLRVGNNVMAPYFSRLYMQGNLKRLQSLVTKSSQIIVFSALPVALAFFFWGGEIAGWVFGREYADAHWPLAVLAAGYFISAGFGSVEFLLSMSGYERIVARFFGYSAAFNIVMNAILIPEMGTYGAAIASALSIVFWSSMLSIQVARKMGIYSSVFWVQSHQN